MNSEVWKKWRLVIKLDPDKILPSQAFEIIRGPKVDAVVVGGTQGISYYNSARLVDSVRQSGYRGPLIQEISFEDSVVPGVDAYFIPAVLNSADRFWLIDAHLNAIKKYGNLIPWEKILLEGYLVCNPDSAVGRLTGAKIVTVEDAVAYILLAERMFNIPIFYIEYSGLFGNMELIRAVSRAKKNIHLVYGGGIKTTDQLILVAELVDTVVIGNIIYESPERAGEIVNTLDNRAGGDR
ncbi:MAG: geranylgeranylglyceryl/heptaprenylglyceryl phosphate synthase [Desulfocucumaceae bacterium]